jgi:hypothetical protein
VRDQQGSSAPEEAVGHWLANAREIAARFGLAGPDAGRAKARRAGWPIAPPSEPPRVHAPRAARHAAAIAARPVGDHPVPNGACRAANDPASGVVLGMLAARLSDDLEAARALAERRAEEIAALRARLVRAEAERDLAARQARAAEIAREQAAQKAVEAEAAIRWWTGGGPLARAWRALLHRTAC